MVTNTTFQLCLWADAVYAMDLKWWTHYHEEVDRDFKGKKLGWPIVVSKYGVTVMQGKMTGFGNSGTDAICYAMSQGAKEVLMLGYDCRVTSKSHWHGDHPKSLSNARSVGQWPEKFKQLAKHAERKGVRVVNVSRQTALRCFERAELENVL